MKGVIITLLACGILLAEDKKPESAPIVPDSLQKEIYKLLATQARTQAQLDKAMEMAVTGCGPKYYVSEDNSGLVCLVRPESPKPDAKKETK